jgi:hypothetical protein
MWRVTGAAGLAPQARTACAGALVRRIAFARPARQLPRSAPRGPASARRPPRSYGAVRMRGGLALASAECHECRYSRLAATRARCRGGSASEIHRALHADGRDAVVWRLAVHDRIRRARRLEGGARAHHLAVLPRRACALSARVATRAPPPDTAPLDPSAWPRFGPRSSYAAIASGGLAAWTGEADRRPQISYGRLRRPVDVFYETYLMGHCGNTIVVWSCTMQPAKRRDGGHDQAGNGRVQVRQRLA